MTMKEAKTPADNHDWRAINIFLFSNGQKDSPPRKYHLKAEDLEVWESTLQSLAHSQLGNEYSRIELFTTDGNKIENPLSLEDDDAYVAVPPSELFIQSGYNKYLLKATRSFDKRRKSTEGSLAIAKENETLPSTVNNETSNVPLNFMPASIASRAINGKQVNTLQRKPMSSAQSLDTPKILANKGSILKRKINSIRGNPPAVSNKITNQKELISKQNINRDSNQRRKVTDNTNSLIKTKAAVKSFFNPTKPNTFNSQHNKLSLITETEFSRPKADSSDKKENSNEQNTGNITEPKKIPIENPNHEQTDGSNPNKPVHEYPEDENDVKNNIIPDLPIPIFQIFSSKNNILVSEKSKVDNYVSLTKGNDFLNLQLCLEIHKPDNMVNSQTDNALGLKSMPNQIRRHNEEEEDITKHTDETKSNITKNIIGNDVAIPKSISSVLMNKGSNKVVVVQCSCRDNFNIDEVFQLMARPMHENNKTYIIFLPPEPNYCENGCKKCCTNSHKNINLDKTTQVSSKIASNNKPFEPKVSNMSLMTIEQEKIIIVNKSEVIIQSDSTQTESSLYPVVQKISTVSKISETITDVAESARPKISETDKLETCDKISQTQWCGVLLEARLQSDGHFTFHFPCLNKLKDFQKSN